MEGEENEAEHGGQRKCLRMAHLKFFGDPYVAQPHLMDRRMRNIPQTSRKNPHRRGVAAAV